MKFEILYAFFLNVFILRALVCSFSLLNYENSSPTYISKVGIGIESTSTVLILRSLVCTLSSLSRMVLVAIINTGRN